MVSSKISRNWSGMRENLGFQTSRSTKYYTYLHFSADKYFQLAKLQAVGFQPTVPAKRAARRVADGWKRAQLCGRGPSNVAPRRRRWDGRPWDETTAIFNKLLRDM